MPNAIPSVGHPGPSLVDDTSSTQPDAPSHPSGSSDDLPDQQESPAPPDHDPDDSDADPEVPDSTDSDSTDDLPDQREPPSSSHDDPDDSDAAATPDSADSGSSDNLLDQPELPSPPDHDPDDSDADPEVPDSTDSDSTDDLPDQREPPSSSHDDPDDSDAAATPDSANSGSSDNLPDQPELPSPPDDDADDVQPREIGGRRTSNAQTTNHRLRPPQMHRPRPKLTCRKCGSRWGVVLEIPDEYQLDDVRYRPVHGGPDTADVSRPLVVEDGKCRLPSFAGSLVIGPDNKEFQLFTDAPLMFKMQSDWRGQGRRVKQLTIGDYIIIVPREWRRTGYTPVDPEFCTDTTFLAHFFSCPIANIGGF